MGTPKKGARRVRKRVDSSASPSDRPEKRRQVSEAPDRPVGVTEQGLKSMLKTLDNLKTQAPA